MLTSLVRRFPIVVLCTSLSLVLYGCSEPGPVEEASDEKPQEEVAAVAFAPAFAPKAPGATSNATQPVASSPSVATPIAAAPAVDGALPGPTNMMITSGGQQFPLFTKDPVLSPSGRPVLYPGRLSWYDPESAEPCSREIGVATNGDIALLEPLSSVRLSSNSNGPAPRKFPVHAAISWQDYRSGDNYRKGATIAALDIVWISSDEMNTSAPKMDIGKGSARYMTGPDGTPIEVPYARPDVVGGSTTGPQMIGSRRPSVGPTGALQPGVALPGGGRMLESTNTVVKKPDPPVPVDATLELPGEVTAARAGADGKYLVLAIPSKKQVVVVNVPEKKIAKTIPASEHVLITAGRTKFVLVDPKSRTVARWSFATLVAEQSKNIGGGEPSLVAMSEFGEGPLWIIDKAKKEDEPAGLRLIDLNKLTPFRIEISTVDRGVEIDLINHEYAPEVSVSAAGDVIFIGERNGQSIIWKIDSGTIEQIEFPDRPGLKFMRPGGSECRMMADGKSFLDEYQLLEPDTKTKFSNEPSFAFPFGPSRDCISIKWDTIQRTKDGERPSPMTVFYHRGAEPTPSAQIRLAELGNAIFRDRQNEKKAEAEDRPFLTKSRRCNYDPASKQFSFITSEPDRIVFKTFDPDATPSQPTTTPPGAPSTGSNVAATTNDAPRVGGAPSGAAAAGSVIQFSRGKPLELQVPQNVLSQGVAPELDSALPGMTISPSGILSWTPAADAPDTFAVIVGIPHSDDLRRFHVIRLEADAKLGPQLSEPQSFPRDRDGSVNLRELPADTFERNLENISAFIVRSGRYSAGSIEREEPPVPAADRFVPEGAEARLVIKVNRERKDLYRMPQDKQVSVETVSNPFRFVRAQGRKVAESVAMASPEVEAVVALPAQISGSTPAGDGRYLLLSLATLNKVAVFDVREGKVKHYVDTESSEFHVAGGLTRFIVLDRRSRTLRRYSLASPAVEKSTVFAPSLGNFTGCGMGVGSEGPIFLVQSDPNAEVAINGEVNVIDLDTLVHRKIERDERITKIYEDCQVDVSADGTRLTCDDSQLQVEILALEGDKLRLVNKSMTLGFEWFRMSRNGEDFFRVQEREFGTGEKLRFGTGNYLFGGDAYLGDLWFGAAFNGRPGRGFVPLQFYVNRDPRPLARINVEGGDWDQRSPLRTDRRVHVSLPEKSVAVVGDYPSRVILTRIDFDAAIAANSAVPFTAKSTPPASFPAQLDLSYQIEVVGKPAGLSFRVVSGPSDMTVAPTGLVTWKGPPAGDPSKRGAIVMVSDGAGNEFAHGFRVPSAAADDASQSLSSPIPAEPAVAEGLYVPLPRAPTQRVVAGDTRYLLLAFAPLQKVAVFDLATAQIVRFIETGTTNFFVAGGATRMIIVDPAKCEMKRFRLDTGVLELTMSYPGGPDGVRGVAMGQASEGPLLMWDVAPLPGQPTPLRVLDLETLKFRLIDAAKSKALSDRADMLFCSISASADGRMFAPNWFGGNTECQAAILEIAGDRLLTRDRFLYARKQSRITRDGDAVTGQYHTYFTSGSDLSLEGLHAGNFSNALWWSDDSQSSVSKFNLYFHKGHSVEKLADVEIPIPFGTRGGDELAEQIYYSQLQKSVAVVYDVPSTIFVRRFDAEAEIARRAVDHIAVTSLPPKAVAFGERLKYQITAVSTDPMLTYVVRDLPNGMTLSPSGLIEWTGPSGEDRSFNVRYTIKNSRGKEIDAGFSVSALSPKRTAEERLGLPHVNGMPVSQTTKSNGAETSAAPIASPGIVGVPQPAGTPQPSTSTSAGATPPSATPQPTATAQPAATGLSQATLTAMRTQPRKWTSSNGATIIATFGERTGDKVTLKRTGTKPIEVDLNQLSPADREFIEKIAPNE